MSSTWTSGFVLLIGFPGSRHNLFSILSVERNRNATEVPVPVAACTMRDNHATQLSIPGK
eukprot:CAMPEP_0197653278 /NCGR_PEP_ID=MMETSP1338-20131121/34957_1 /TAXON_ID=43686 ORGANISM="Pelagodinium beii, Strain RCC1491" /NCGR_SAMPLE_ID=MMETSP1338 /ASSEMBLY_ACC=CAM_ASM_000754 /LENGTH=59 /DNA_ID=CAMNT_0043228321 /DNA_START=40 /DNA_END=219 /DNA_ORIENTATION=+